MDGMLLISLCLVGIARESTRVAAAEARIELVEFRIAPLELPVGQSFTIGARAQTAGVKLGSFLLRTAEDTRREDRIPGFSLYANGRYYLAQNGEYYLRDNGPLDGDPRAQAISLRVPTQDWKEGRRVFAFFASCRPSDGPFVAARRDFAVTVQGDRVRIEDLGAAPLNLSRAITGFAVEPAVVERGGVVRITLQSSPGTVAGLRFSSPFYITAGETLPGFRYDETKKKAYYPASAPGVMDNGELDRDPAEDRMVVEWNTADWPSGVQHLQLDALGRSGNPVDQRSLAIQVRDRRDRLEVLVESSRFFAPGTHFGRFARLRDGTLLCEGQWSADGGQTWQGATGGFGVGGEQLRGGEVLGLEYRCLPVDGSPGQYTVQRSWSNDGGRSFGKSQARVLVPEATAAMGHGPHLGPLFMRSIVQREDGTLVGLFAGWFKSDTALCPYGRGRPYSRTYVCQADADGMTWQYLTTIGYEQLGSEGYNEGALRRLADGRWLAVMRTGNERDLGCQDNPIMGSFSRDEGRTWSPPQRTGLEGAYPGLAVLSDGQLVISYGRPGAMIAFSADGGQTWTDRTAVDATPYSGYTDVVEVAPGRLLVGFGAKDFLDPETNRREDQLRLATVRYRPRGSEP